MGAASQPRGPDGRWIKGGAGAVATVMVGALALGGMTSGGVGAGTLAAESAGSAASPLRIGQSRSAARKGRANDAWSGLRLRKVREAAEHALDCAVHSYGQVNDFLIRNPCRSLDRMLFTLADPDGNTFVVSVSWVRMRQRGDVRELKKLIDVDGTGSIAPIGFEPLRDQGIRFTGTPFRSRRDGDQLVVAEGAVVSGRPDAEFFDTVVDVAAQLRR